MVNSTPISLSDLFNFLIEDIGNRSRDSFTSPMTGSFADRIKNEKPAMWPVSQLAPQELPTPEFDPNLRKGQRPIPALGSSPPHFTLDGQYPFQVKFLQL
jgi:hypothetical protein